MICVVGVRFKRAGKVYYFDPGEFPIQVGNKVVVETARGIEYGEVAVGPKMVSDDQVVQPLKKVVRPGTEKDAAVAAENKRKEKEAFSIAQKKIESHALDMNLVDVEYTFDGSKNIFYFTAEGRVDFRELVRDLAGVFRTRIEMRQIGVRDEAKLLGGIGPCGRILCCTSFLGDFAPVSIRMAKDQNLSLNPSKISGLCGRLMCCLRYEQETYEAAKKDPTLAPGYVPPVVIAEQPEAAFEDEERRPRIGLESGLSARIAQASGLAAPQKPRQEPAHDRRPAGEQQRQGGQHGARQQGIAGTQRPAGQTKPPREHRQGQPGHQQRQHAPARTQPAGQAGQVSQGQRKGQPQPHSARNQATEHGQRNLGANAGQRPHQSQRPAPSDVAPRNQSEQQREEKQQGERRGRNRHRGHRNRANDKPQAPGSNQQS